MRAHIQADLVSDRPHGPLSRPHSSGSGLYHGSPSFKWIGSASSCRALNHAGPPRPHSSDLIAPRGARPHSKDLANPPSRAPSFKASGLHAPSAPSFKQSGCPDTLAPSFKPFRSHPINAHIQATQVSGRLPDLLSALIQADLSAQKPPSITSGNSCQVPEDHVAVCQTGEGGFGTTVAWRPGMFVL
jgi:hypothetical protein